MTAIAVNKEEFVRRCEEVYRRESEQLEKDHEGKLVALYEDGIAAMGTNIDEVCKLAEKKFPDKVFYVRRVGKYPAAGILF